MIDTSFIFTLLALGCFLATILIANRSEALRQEFPSLRYLLYGLIAAAVVAAFTALQGAFRIRPTVGVPPLTGTPGNETVILIYANGIDPASAVVNFALAILIAALSIAVFHAPSLRLRIEQLLRPVGVFSADSPVHATALVLMLVVVSLNLSSFILGGGLTGLADTLETQTYSLGDVLFNQLIWLLVSFLGVGLFLRRDLGAALSRLGLRVPKRADLIWGVLVGVGAFGLLFLFSGLLQSLTPQDVLEAQNQASNSITGAFNTIGLAFIGMILVAIGEEVFFRGAIQPVFGIVASSIFFTLLHSQYLFTPATLALFVVSLLFGWVRRRHSTTASIIAHFVYNFIQLALVLLASSALEQAAGVLR